MAIDTLYAFYDITYTNFWREILSIPTNDKLQCETCTCFNESDRYM